MRMRKRLKFGQKIGYTVVAGLAMMVAETASRVVINEGWRRTTHTAPPRNPERPGITWRQALTYGAVTGAAGGLIGVVARKFAARFYFR